MNIEIDITVVSLYNFQSNETNEQLLTDLFQQLPTPEDFTGSQVLKFVQNY